MCAFRPPIGMGMSPCAAGFFPSRAPPSHLHGIPGPYSYWPRPVGASPQGMHPQKFIHPVGPPAQPNEAGRGRGSGRGRGGGRGSQRGDYLKNEPFGSRPPLPPPLPSQNRHVRPPCPPPSPILPPGSLKRSSSSCRPLNWLSGWLSLYDRDLPDELIAKCKPLYCDLCKASLNSADQAKMHYVGKTHDKNSRQFLTSWAAANGCQAPKKMTGEATIPPPSKKVKLEPEAKEDLKADELYCSVCEINFTSKQHSEQHYQGRNHARKAAGLNPLKSGYKNQYTGKWQRHPPSARLEARSDLVSNGGCVVQLPGGISETTSKVEVKKTAPEATAKRFFCQICKVAATSQQQFDMHLQGKAHKSRFTSCQATPNIRPASSPIVKDSKLQTPMTPGQGSANVIKNKLTKSSEDRDYSQFRTPSGLYYCASCNLSLNSENQFVQHIGSKKHRSKQLQRLPRDARERGRGRGRGKSLGDFCKI